MTSIDGSGPTTLVEHLIGCEVITGGNRRFAEAYDLPRIRRVHHLIRRHSSAPQQLRVLNIGLLDGLVPLSLLWLDPNLTIASTERPDADPKQATGPPALQATGRHDVARFDLTGVGHDFQGFDWVICGEVLEHLPSPTLPCAMRNLRAAAQRAVITTPNLHALRYRLRHLLGVDFQHDPVAHAVMGLGHVSLLSARLLIDLAADAGLAMTDLEFHSWTSDAQSPKRRALARLTGPIRSLSDDLVAAFVRDAQAAPSSQFGATYVPLRAGLSDARDLARLAGRSSARAPDGR